ncbi:hypothetical protein HHK36_005118 [Tetracentron sinense]|uniref:Protein SCAR n=1 Tax=Tetracentron sinense TaxID=13715 RepID=A0A834ZKY7_TETSI|nr:hypothetical protein HHK36_005118 [Tetracentron sinense]
MPLVQFQLRNEYGLGAPELYKAANRDDPKAVLDGVAVAGLVGILRQLGDLAETKGIDIEKEIGVLQLEKNNLVAEINRFASEVFHDLQEQVMATAARSHKMIVRVQHIEEALPPLEKAVLAQTSHIHFAYTTGSDWHAHIPTEQNHLIHSDLPRFIMDSYEECRDPPRFYLLDKFDTGGPGSCLKRYSDPSFFKRALASSDLVSAEKVQREKKVHKSKKKGPRRRNGDVSRGASLSSRSGRMQFTSPNIHGQSSAAQTLSTFNMTLRSDLGNRSPSFDSRTTSGYIECVFDGSSSLRPEEQEENELFSSRLKMQHGDTIDTGLPDEQNGVTDDDFSLGSLQEKNSPSSSFVTWDEKTEIVKPTVPDCDNVVDDQGEDPELLPTISDLDSLEREAVGIGNVDQTDTLFGDGNTPESIFGENQFDEIGSEPDNYMDALNTMEAETETETETDFECETKREVELHSSNFNDKGMSDGTGVMQDKGMSDGTGVMQDKGISDGTGVMQEINSNLSDVNSPTASYSSPDTEMSHNLFTSVSSEGLAYSQPSQITSMFSNPDSSVDTGLCENDDIIDVSRIESVISDPSSSCSRIPNSQASSGDKIISSLCKPQESPAEIIGAPSVKFWTNGGLLGLEPSKPPDCSVSNVMDSAAGTNDNAHDPSSPTVMPKGDGFVRKMDKIVHIPESIENDPSSLGRRHRSDDIAAPTDFPHDHLVKRTGNLVRTSTHSESSTSCHDNQDDDMSTKKKFREFPPTVLDANLEKSKNSHHSNSFSHTHGCGFKETNVMTPEAEMKVASDVKDSSTEVSQENMESSSSMFGLSHRLLVNGFQSKASPVHGDKSNSAFSEENGVMKLQEQLCIEQKNGPNPKELFECGSPTNSLSSSPPLEHMKISFHPINGFETSKLKLKFPDGRQCHESIRGVMFPSFQLLPEPASPLYNIGCESDDDTFCRSSPYMSDDLLSHHSESNSEQWESEGTPGSNHELYDALRRVSSTESISSSFELAGISHGSIHIDYEFNTPDTENVVKPFHSGPLPDLPSFDAVNPLNQEETENDTDTKNPIDSKLHFPDEPTPPPPPLPPLQWRIMTPHFAAEEDKQVTVSEVLNHPNDLQLLGSPTQQPKPDPPKLPDIEEVIAGPPKSKDQKFNGPREATQTANGTEMDEKEDFLHQIRTKSFSLRRTVTARPTLTPGPTTNIKVTAILEKANAIRQAFVGSDEGEDNENWSDG